MSFVKPEYKKLLMTFLLLFTFVSVLPAESTISIGFLGDFSSVSRSYTANMYLAAQLWVTEINEAGGVLGNKVNLVKMDGGNDPAKHAELAKKLILDQKIVALFGGASSPPVIAASAVCRELRVPYLVSIGNSQDIVVEQGHPFVFQFQPTSAMETKGFAIFATLMPWKRYAWVGPDYSWGRDVLKDFKYQFSEMGTTLKWTTEAWHPLGTVDFAPIIRKIMDGKPDALVIGSYGEDVKYFITQSKKQGLFEKLAVFGWFTYDMGNELGKLVPNGMWSLARGGPFNYLAEKYPKSARFADQLFKVNGSYPNGYTICCYDSLIAWSTAVVKAGTADPVKVSAALKGLRFESLRGDSTIRAIDGQMDCPTYFGRLVYVDKYPIAVWESVVEIPASKTWLNDTQIKMLRAGKPGK
jgi:branched-chain amino acid transport system substrate-binding protein